MSAKDDNTRLAYVRGLARGFSEARVPGSVSDARLRALLDSYGNFFGRQQSLCTA